MTLSLNNGNEQKKFESFLRDICSQWKVTEWNRTKTKKEKTKKKQTGKQIIFSGSPAEAIKQKSKKNKQTKKQKKTSFTKNK